VSAGIDDPFVFSTEKRDGVARDLRLLQGVDQSSTPIILPLWQLMVVFVGLPAMYLLNSMLPWSIGLITAREHDFFWQFWASIAALHWSSFALVCLLLRRAGRRLSEIGLQFSPFRIALMFGMPASIGGRYCDTGFLFCARACHRHQRLAGGPYRVSHHLRRRPAPQCAVLWRRSLVPGICLRPEDKSSPSSSSGQRLRTRQSRATTGP
jgi:hypothetical protein